MACFERFLKISVFGRNSFFCEKTWTVMIFFLYLRCEKKDCIIINQLLAYENNTISFDDGPFPMRIFDGSEGKLGDRLE